MRKRKINIGRPIRTEEIPDPEALATQREEDYEAVSGETSTEGQGPGWDAPPETPTRSLEGLEGGQDMEPPTKPAKQKAGKVHRNPRRLDRVPPPGQHRAARSSRKI